MSWIWAQEITAKRASIAEFEQQHLRKVLRRKAGDRLKLIDGRGTRAEGIWQASGDIAIEDLEQLAPPHHTLVLALGARESNESAIRRAAELGARAILPVYSARSRDARAPRNIPVERWQTIIRSGCAQAGNPWLPELLPAQTWADFRAKTDSRQIAALCPKATRIITVNDLRAYIAVGPEGGWQDDELAGLDCFGLGLFAMRTPVAVTAVLSLALRGGS